MNNKINKELFSMNDDFDDILCWFQNPIINDDNELINRINKVSDNIEKVISRVFVLLRYKYDCDKEWDYAFEYFYLYWPKQDWMWENDWYEGQENVEYLGFVDVEDLELQYRFIAERMCEIHEKRTAKTNCIK